MRCERQDLRYNRVQTWYSRSTPILTQISSVGASVSTGPSRENKGQLKNRGGTNYGVSGTIRYKRGTIDRRGFLGGDDGKMNFHFSQSRHRLYATGNNVGVGVQGDLSSAFTEHEQKYIISYRTARDCFRRPFRNNNNTILTTTTRSRCS